MKAYIKEHPAEFAVEGQTTDDEAKEETFSEPTEAAAYAAQQRKERDDRDYSLMHGGLDSVVSGIKSIISGLRSVTDALSDMFDGSVSKEGVFALIIVVLVVSNFYTYFAYKSSRTDVEIRRSRLGYRNDDVENAVRAILRERERPRSAVEEARELQRILDEVGSRYQRLQIEIGTIGNKLELD